MYDRLKLDALDLAKYRMLLAWTNRMGIHFVADHVCWMNITQKCTIALIIRRQVGRKSSRGVTRKFTLPLTLLMMTRRTMMTVGANIGVATAAGVSHMLCESLAHHLRINGKANLITGKLHTTSGCKVQPIGGKSQVGSTFGVIPNGLTAHQCHQGHHRHLVRNDRNVFAQIANRVSVVEESPVQIVDPMQRAAAAAKVLRQQLAVCQSLALSTCAKSMRRPPIFLP
jgi:hypothetical protein